MDVCVDVCMHACVHGGGSRNRQNKTDGGAHCTAHLEKGLDVCVHVAFRGENAAHLCHSLSFMLAEGR
jgi:hypothetical protein